MTDLDRLVELTGHERYRELFASDPGTWGPIVRDTLAALAGELPPLSDEDRVYEAVITCRDRVEFAPDERPSCGCPWKCAAGKGDPRRRGAVDFRRDCLPCARNRLNLQPAINGDLLGWGRAR